ncbi:ABC transporter permease [Ruoffia tabacinasalis]|uniref:ABC transporter permease n=1 Tax=Ruoffia tabacinasalis TaxID=87458 RepID=A0ABS0LMT1_9LACT|nr:ABC transporter permease [Ruoffia tabacinasalis]MBG9978746.1 ABC transporter permease [Ruoffia tabacinasalis]
MEHIHESIITKNKKISSQLSILRIPKRFLNSKMLVTGIILFALMVVVVLFAPQIARIDPYEINPINRLQAPSADYWFGTDEFGRDVFSRSIYGVRNSFVIGMTVAIVSTIPALIIGLVSAYYPIWDNVLMRIVDGIYAFPAILLAIAIVSIRGANVENLIIALGIVYIPAVSRVIRSAALSIKGKDYIQALDSQGANSIRILLVHMLPNILPTLLIQVTYIFAQAIITESALSFLGAGIPAPMPSLGNILFDGKVVIYQAWWMTIFPGLFIVMLVMGLNFLGDGLTSVLGKRNKSIPKRKKGGILNGSKKITRSN